MKRFIAISFMGLVAVSAFAQQLPLDPGTGLTLFTSNMNDGYDIGRGMLFQVNTSFNVVGAGFSNDFFGNESFTESLYMTNGTNNGLHTTLLGSFSMTPVAGNGYQDGTFAGPITLVAGNFYYLEVTSNDNFAGNYFYNWNGPGVNLGNVTVLDGGMGGDPGALGNTVAPAVRLLTSSVPEPATFAVLGLGALALIRRRRNQA